jgi:hypothetical protein
MDKGADTEAAMAMKDILRVMADKAVANTAAAAKEVEAMADAEDDTALADAEVLPVTEIKVTMVAEVLPMVQVPIIAHLQGMAPAVHMIGMMNKR